MHIILCGDLVEIECHGMPDDPLLGLVLGVATTAHQGQLRQFFQVRYSEEGHTDSRWINEKFIRKA